MVASDFSAAFRALTGQAAPFAWQRRLYRELAAGALPDAVDIPTGLGKTKVMALWLIAIAGGTELPRRLVYVVDRRAVVDQATEEADGLAQRLKAFLGDGALDTETRIVCRRNLGLSGGRELPVSTLRGQFADNRRWLDNPGSAAIVVGTIDMIGSRLLFGGYGVSARMRPAHAGLLGADALVVLDEAHLVPPFQALLRQVAKQTAHDRGRSAVPVVPGFRLMALSATGRISAGARIFGLSAEDEGDVPARARLEAEKRLKVLGPVASSDIIGELTERAWRLGESDASVLVFCNSRKVAQKVADELVDRSTKAFGREAINVALLVGERRVHERERLRDRNTREGAVFFRFDPERHKEGGAGADGPAFLVATSAGEVGVDLDADHLVCDLVAWERMVQRFGRVNRRPKPGSAQIEVIPTIAERKKDKDAEDEIDKERLTTLLAPFESAHWPRHGDGSLNACPLALRRLKGEPGLKDKLVAAETEEPLRPALTRPLVEAFSLTSLKEHPGRPEIAPWLRGWVKEEPRTAVAWRLLFPLRADGESGFADDVVTRRRELATFFESAPPHLTEVLEAPTWRVTDVLRKRAEAWRKSKRAAAHADHGHPPVIVVLNRRSELEDVYTADWVAEAKRDTAEYRFADRTLVVDARLGGLDASGLLDEQAADLPQTLDGEPVDALWTGRAGLRIGRVTSDAHSEDDWQKGWRVAERWAEVGAENKAEASGMEIRIEKLRTADAVDEQAALAKSRQYLNDHHRWAEHHAADIADLLRLGEPWKEMLIAAAGFHDAGKARRNWQTYAGNPGFARDSENSRPLAKFDRRGDPARLKIGADTYRHEFGTLRDADLPLGNLLPELQMAARRLHALPDEQRELALHLIAAHHGHGRPAIPTVDEAAPSSEKLAREVALRFARLQRHWGPWGLAWWETLLRAADWAASRQLNETPGSSEPSTAGGDLAEWGPAPAEVHADD